MGGGEKKRKKRISSLAGMIKMVWGSLAKCASSLRLSCAEMSVPGAVSYDGQSPLPPALGERWETAQGALGTGWIMEKSTLLALIVSSLTRRKGL